MSPTSPGFLHRFLDIAQAHPDQCAIRDLDSPGGDFTYATELIELARDLGPEYEREVVHRDDLVVLHP